MSTAVLCDVLVDCCRIHGYYKFLSFLSFNIWWKYRYRSIFWSGLYKPSTKQCNFMQYLRQIRLPVKSEFRKQICGGNSRYCVTDGYCVKNLEEISEERIPRTDWFSYPRRCLWAEFVCKVRYFCKCFFLEMNLTFLSREALMRNHSKNFLGPFQKCSVSFHWSQIWQNADTIF